MQDEMTPRQRKKAFREGRDIDRLPTWAFPQDYCSRLIGATLREYMTDTKTFLKGVLTADARWDFDVVEMMIPLGIDLGVERSMPEDDYGVVTKTIDPTEKEIESWGVEDVRTNPAAQPGWERLEALQDALAAKDRAEISLMVSMPFTTAAMSLGTDKFLKKLIRDPDYVHLIVGKLADMIVQAVQAFKGLDVLYWCPDPVASGSMLSLAQYRTFAQPYTAKVLHALQEIAPHPDHVNLHMCGNTTRLWEAMADTGALLMNIDETIDFADASRRVGDRVHLVGNVAPMTMLIGSEQDVIEDVKRSIRDAAGGKALPIPGFADSPPLKSPVENHDALHRALREYAKWPLDEERLRNW